METYILTIGAQEFSRMFQADLGALWLKRKVPEKTLKRMIKDGQIKPEEADKAVEHSKLSVREIKLLALAYPEECHDIVMSAMAPYADLENSILTKVRSAIKPLFKLMGIKTYKNKELWAINQGIPPNRIFNKYVKVLPLGTKKDRYHEGEEQI